MELDVTFTVLKQQKVDAIKNNSPSKLKCCKKKML